MKTLVTSLHSPGPHENGYAGCYSRADNGGMCPGVKHAEWLNNLGPDDEVHNKSIHRKITNGQVRDNYLRRHYHVVALEPELARASARIRHLRAELRIAMNDLKRLIKLKAEVPR